MNQQEITNNNRLIAEFMDGISHDNRNGCYTFVKAPPSFISGRWTARAADLYYHNRWDWLMPVVEKIAAWKYDTTVDAYAFPRTFGMINEETGYFMVRISRCPLFQAPTLIEATYLAVIDFITWYNQNNNGTDNK